MPVFRTEAEVDELLTFFDQTSGVRKIELPKSWIIAAPSSDYESICCKAAITAHTHGEDYCVVSVGGGYICMSAMNCISFYGETAFKVAECLVTKDGTVIKAKHL